MKTKKLFVPLALILFAVIFSAGHAKAQAPQYRPVWVYLEMDDYSIPWYITYHNNDTNTDYNFDTSSATDNSIDVGMVPLGNYTISVSRHSTTNGYIDFQYGGNSASTINEAGPIFFNSYDPYTFDTNVNVVSDDTETDIFISNN